MAQATYSFRPCYQQIDGDTTVDFLFLQKDELYLPDRTAVSQVINLLFEKGGIFGAFDQQQQMHAMLGFFFGEPAQDFRNKDILFIYVTAISRSYRLTRLFRDGFAYCLRQFQDMGLHEIRMQAGETDRYTNKLYGRFAHPLGQGKTLRGKPVITYGNTIDGALASLEMRQRATLQHVPIYIDKQTAKHAAALLP